MSFHLIGQPQEPCGQPMLMQHRRAQFGHQRSSVLERVGQHVIGLLHDFNGTGWRLRQPHPLSQFELAQHQHLLQMVMKLGGQPFALTLLGQV